MNTPEQIEAHLNTLSEPKRKDIQALHQLILQLFPGCKLWYFNGKNEEGKVIANPTLGYGNHTINYANGTSRDVFRIGLLATQSGISIHIMGISDKLYLSNTFGQTIGKAKLTGYCISFKALKDINISMLESAIQYGMSL